MNYSLWQFEHISCYSSLCSILPDFSQQNINVLFWQYFQERLEECVKLLDDYKAGTLPEGTTDQQLWEAQKIKQVPNIRVCTVMKYLGM